MKSINFEKWVPDGDPKIGQLVECNGLIPYDGKLMPWLGAVPLSSGALTGTSGFVLFNVLDPAANNKTFLGTTTRIHRLDGATLTDVSIAAKYTLTGTETWDWCVYQDKLIMTTIGEDVQVLSDIDSGSNFADLAGSPNKSRCCAMYKDHLFLGNQAAGDPGKERRVQISATGSIIDFTPDTANGAGTLLLPSFGEEIIALQPIGNYLAAYLTDSVYLIDFIGAPFWFSATKMEIGVGLLGTNAVAQIDKSTHLILGKKDIYAVTPGDIVPMGAGLRRRVIDTIHPDNFHRITHYVDRSKKVVVWSWPSTSGDGSPDKALVYNWEENRASEIDLDANCIGNIKSATTVINDISAKFNDVSLTFDDQSWLGGTDYNGVVMDSDKKVSYLGGAAVDGFVETGEIDFEDVYEIQQLRPIIQKPQGTVTGIIKHRFRDNDDYSQTSNTMGSNGLIDLQATGRLQKIRLEITGAHDGLRGCKFDEVKTGGR